MFNKLIISGPPLTRKKYTAAFEAECMRQVAAGAWQTDIARAAWSLAALCPGAGRAQQCEA